MRQAGVLSALLFIFCIDDILKLTHNIGNCFILYCSKLFHFIINLFAYTL